MEPAETLSRPKTRDRILDVSLALFNGLGFANTSISRIAEAAGIAVGNLWYHFRTKQDLLHGLTDRFRDRLATRLEANQGAGPVLETYVSLIHGVIQDIWSFRFLMRDRLELVDLLDPIEALEDVTDAHAARLHELLEQMREEGLFREKALDLGVLETNLWIVIRYWSDHLQERERVDRMTWDDQERGFQQHLAILVPQLKADARREIGSAVATVAERHSG
jgi:AcrR family transcriptional regulator